MVCSALHDIPGAASRRQQPSSTATSIPALKPTRYHHKSPMNWFVTSSTDTNIRPSSLPSHKTPASTQEESKSSVNYGYQGTATFLPSDTYTNRFKNLFNMLTGQMSEPGAKQYWSDADQRYAAIDCARCEKQRDYLLQYSPVIRYMTENISRLGGELNKSNIRCRVCTTAQLGGFDHKFGIMLCANQIEQQSMLEDVMAHEMVHAYDHLRFKTDLGPEEDLRKVACSEIRASNLSGECRWANEFFTNKQFSFSRHHQDCVRRRAVNSVRTRPNCKDDLEAVKIVNDVWDSCFVDTRPFDEIYRWDDQIKKPTFGTTIQLSWSSIVAKKVDSKVLTADSMRWRTRLLRWHAGCCVVSWAEHVFRSIHQQA